MNTLVDKRKAGMEIEIIFEPKHWNRNCACMIPEAWTAFIVSEDGGGHSKWPCGTTRDEAIANVKREYPDAVIS